MQNKTILLPIVLLLITIASYISFIKVGEIRPVEFLIILAMGMFIGVILTQLFKRKSR